MKSRVRTLGILDHAASRTRAVVTKITAAMRAIEADIEREDGVYPFNAGRLSRQEVCRRAGIRPSVLDGPSHKTTTLRDVQDWLAAVHRGQIKGSKNVRRAVTARTDEWKARAHQFAQSTHLYQLEMLSLRRKLQEANDHIRQLESEIALLQVEVGKGKVVKLRD